MNFISPGNKATLPESADALGVELAQAAASEATEAIGRVAATDGLVEAVRADGSRVTLAKGDPIFQGDTIETGNGAAIGVTFVDDSTFSLGGDGQMTIDEMVYDPGAQSGVMKSNMVEGVFSFVSGQIARSAPDAMTVQTPVATIGVRGTKVAGVAAPEGQPNSISLLPEIDSAGNTVVGELSVSNSAGTVTLNQTGATVQMISAFTPPPPPVTFSPTQIQQQYSVVLATLPPSPPPPPVDNSSGNQGDQQGNTPQDGDTPQDGNTPQDGDTSADGAPPEGDQTAQAAIAADASPEDAFAVAEAAAEQQQLAEGASLGEVAAGKALAEQVFQDSLASGMTTDESIQAALQAAEALRNGPGFDLGGTDGQFGSTSGPGVDLLGGVDPFGPGGDLSGGDLFAGDSGDSLGGGGNDFLGNPFDSLGTLLGGGEFAGGGGNTVIFDAGDEQTTTTTTVTASGSSSSGTGGGQLVSSGSITLGAGGQTANVNSNNIGTVIGGSGDDTITVTGSGTISVTGGSGADTLNFNGSGIQTAVYTTSTDGATTAGANTGYDTITSFASGTDKIALTGSLLTAINDITSNNSTLDWATDPTTVDFSGTDEALILTAAGVSNADLIANGFSSVLTAINNIALTASTNDDALIAINGGGGQTGIYYYQESVGSTNSVSLGDLTMLALVDATLATTDFEPPPGS